MAWPHTMPYPIINPSTIIDKYPFAGIMVINQKSFYWFELPRTSGSVGVTEFTNDL
jgi:hypothetical protein